MTALTLLNHLRPFEWTENGDFYSSTYESQMKYNNEKSAWELIVELTGVTKDKIKLDVKENNLIISGHKTKGLNLGQFERYFNLPEGIDTEKIEATFEDGVLEVLLPLEEKRAAKTIQIK